MPSNNVFRVRDVDVAKVKIVLTDMDGTLYPSIPSAELARSAITLADKYLEGDKKQAFFEAYRALFKDFLSSPRPVYGDFMTGELSVESSRCIRPQIVEDLGVLFKLAFVKSGLRFSKADLLLHQARVSVLSERGAIVNGFNDNLSELMSVLTGKPKIVVSNSPLITIEGVLDLLDVKSQFQEVYESCKKPIGLVAVINHVLAVNKLVPSEALYIGDSYGMEIVIARSMGIPAVYISSKANQEMLKNFNENDAEPPLIIAKTLNDVGAYLNRR